MLLVSLQEVMLLLKADEGKMQSPLEVQEVIGGSVVQCFSTCEKMDLCCMECARCHQQTRGGTEGN